MAKHQPFFKNPDFDLRLRYRRVFEVSLIIALFMLTVLFYSFKSFKSTPVVIELPGPLINLEDIPPTKIENKVPPPLRPEIPVAGENEELPEALTIEQNTDIRLAQLPKSLPPPPSPEPEPIVPYEMVSEKPYVIKQVSPYYPELARKAGIEGTVVVKVLVGTDGNVEEVEIVQSQPMLDQAAVAAAKQFKFHPGKQRDRFVRVWVSIPFKFRLNR